MTTSGPTWYLIYYRNYPQSTYFVTKGLLNWGWKCHLLLRSQIKHFISPNKTIHGIKLKIPLLGQPRMSWKNFSMLSKWQEVACQISGQFWVSSSVSPPVSRTQYATAELSTERPAVLQPLTDQTSAGNKAGWVWGAEIQGQWAPLVIQGPRAPSGPFTSWRRLPGSRPASPECDCKHRQVTHPSSSFSP